VKLVQTDNETCVDGVPLRFIDGVCHRFGLKYVRCLEIEDVRGSGLKDGSYEYEYYVRLLFTGLRYEGEWFERWVLRVRILREVVVYWFKV